MKHISNDKVLRAIDYMKNYNRFDAITALGYLLIAIYDMLKEMQENA